MERFQPLDNTSTIATAATLTLQLNALRNQLGTVNVVLFADAAGFPKDAAQAVRSGSFPVAGVPLLVRFPDVPFGQYAVAVHHDEDQDGEVNVNALGIPKEGIGFSNDPKILIGTPSFKKASFTFSAADQMIVITVKYLLR